MVIFSSEIMFTYQTPDCLYKILPYIDLFSREHKLYMKIEQSSGHQIVLEYLLTHSSEKV